MISFYFTFLFLTTILLFRSHLNKNIEMLNIPVNFINKNLQNFNKFIQNGFNSKLVFETGVIDILLLLSIFYFFLTGYFYTEYPTRTIISLVIFEFILIYFYNNGRIITICLLSIIFYLIGYHFGKKRIEQNQLKLYNQNQNKLVEYDLPE